MAGLLAALAGCSYQDFARPPIRNYAADLFYKPERPPDPGTTDVRRLDELAAAMARWRKMVGPTAEPYTLGPGDVLKVFIVVPAEPDAAVSAQVELSGEGTGTCPFLGDVPLAGLSADEAETELAQLYGDGYYRDPQISVVVSEHRSKQVFMTGAVGEPGVVHLKADRVTFLEVLLQSGGLTEGAGDKAEVTRVHELVGGEGGLRANTVQVDVARLIKGSDMVENIWIYAGDVIHVPAEERCFYVLGYVRAPGVYPFPASGSLRSMDAIAYARGLSGWAHPGKVYLHRRTEDGLQDVYRIDLSRVAAAQEPDVTMCPGDMIIVRTSWGRRFIEGILHSLGLVQMAPLPSQ